MFDPVKKQTAIEALAAMCHHCGDKHSDECPLAKTIAATKLIPTQDSRVDKGFWNRIKQVLLGN